METSEMKSLHEELIAITDAAEKYGVCRRTMKRLANEGKLGPVHYFRQTPVVSVRGVREAMKERAAK
jgi:hypothetical protein